MAELRNRDKIEASFARRMSRLSSRHRRELIALLGTPPDPNNVPQEFWDRVRKESEDDLLLMMLLIYGTSAKQHGLDAALATERAERYAQRRAAEVAQGYVDHSRERIAEKARAWGERTRPAAPSTGPVGEAPPPTPPTKREVLDDVMEIFGPKRSEGIAVNETTNAQTRGGEDTIDTLYGFSDDDTWYTRDDGKVCEICAPLHRTKRSVWMLKFPDGPGDSVHPGDRCWIKYAPISSRVPLGAA